MSCGFARPGYPVFVLLGAALAGSAWAAPARADDVRVTVIAIAASDRHPNVDPKLTELAKAVQKYLANLSGFRVERTTSKDLNVGPTESFDLGNSASADITVIRKDDSKQRVSLKVRPPMMGEITYWTCYDKFFPIVTDVKVNGDRLVIAVMVQPVKDKK